MQIETRLHKWTGEVIENSKTTVAEQVVEKPICQKQTK